jgi:hypothetical protein
MNTMLKTGVVAAALIGAIGMTATPSEARCRNCGAAAAGFVGGLAVGAIASNAYNNSYYGPRYGYGYGYAPGYAYEPGYAYYGGPGYYSGGPGYYDSYAYAPAPRRHQSLSQYRDGTGHVAGTDSLSDR